MDEIVELLIGPFLGIIVGAIFFNIVKESPGTLPVILSLASMIYLVAIVADDMSTYCCARRNGLNFFFEAERNPAAKCCVAKFGLVKGLVLSEFHYKRLVVLGCLWGSVGGPAFIFYYAISGVLLPIVAYLIPGIFLVGMMRIDAARHNFYLSLK